MSKKRKRKSTSIPQDAEGVEVVPDAVEVASAQRAEFIFHRTRVALFGGDKAMWRIREPGFAFAQEHLWAVSNEVVEGLRARGHVVPEGFDPFVMAAAAEQRRLNSTPAI